MAGIGIGAISNNRQAYSPQKAAEKLASGKKINSAADDAAGLAIAKKLESQTSGARVASNNAKDMRNLLNVADGGMSQIAGGLERIRELKIQSMNGIYTEDDKKIFQEEIDGILKNIDSFGKDTAYNGKTILDGSFTAKNAAIGPNAESTEINIGSALSEDLGISEYNVSTGSIGDIDKALDSVLTQMANVGAQTNRMEYAGRVADTMAYNTEVARSRLEDADIAKESAENNRQKITEQTKLSMQKMQMQGMGSFLQMIG